MPPAVAVQALINYGVDIAIASGALWASADLIDNLGELVDHLEQRKQNEEPEPLIATLHETPRGSPLR